MKVIRTLKTKGTKKMKKKWIMLLLSISLSMIIFLIIFKINKLMGITYFGTILLFIGTKGIETLKIEKRSIIYGFFEIIFILFGLILIFLGLNIYANKVQNHINQQQIKQQVEQIEAVQEFEANKEISADKAWWINMPIENLKEKCQKMAEVIGKDWEYLVDILSGKRAVLKLIQIK